MQNHYHRNMIKSGNNQLQQMQQKISQLIEYSQQNNLNEDLIKLRQMNIAMSKLNQQNNHQFQNHQNNQPQNGQQYYSYNLSSQNINTSNNANNSLFQNYHGQQFFSSHQLPYQYYSSPQNTYNSDQHHDNHDTYYGQGFYPLNNPINSINNEFYQQAHQNGSNQETYQNAEISKAIYNNNVQYPLAQQSSNNNSLLFTLSQKDEQQSTRPTTNVLQNNTLNNQKVSLYSFSNPYQYSRYPNNHLQNQATYYEMQQKKLQYQGKYPQPSNSAVHYNNQNQYDSHNNQFSVNNTIQIQNRAISENYVLVNNDLYGRNQIFEYQGNNGNNYLQGRYEHQYSDQYTKHQYSDHNTQKRSVPDLSLQNQASYQRPPFSKYEQFAIKISKLFNIQVQDLETIYSQLRAEKQISQQNIILNENNEYVNINAQKMNQNNQNTDNYGSELYFDKSDEFSDSQMMKKLFAYALQLKSSHNQLKSMIHTIDDKYSVSLSGQSKSKTSGRPPSRINVDQINQSTINGNQVKQLNQIIHHTNISNQNKTHSASHQMQPQRPKYLQNISINFMLEQQNLSKNSNQFKQKDKTQRQNIKQTKGNSHYNQYHQNMDSKNTIIDNLQSQQIVLNSNQRNLGCNNTNKTINDEDFCLSQQTILTISENQTNTNKQKSYLNKKSKRKDRVNEKIKQITQQLQNLKRQIEIQQDQESSQNQIKEQKQRSPQQLAVNSQNPDHLWLKQNNHQQIDLTEQSPQNLPSKYIRNQNRNFSFGLHQQGQNFNFQQQASQQISHKQVEQSQVKTRIQNHALMQTPSHSFGSQSFTYIKSIQQLPIQYPQIDKKIQQTIKIKTIKSPTKNHQPKNLHSQNHYPSQNQAQQNIIVEPRQFQVHGQNQQNIKNQKYSLSQKMSNSTIMKAEQRKQMFKVIQQRKKIKQHSQSHSQSNELKQYKASQSKLQPFSLKKVDKTVQSSTGSHKRIKTSNSAYLDDEQEENQNNNIHRQQSFRQLSLSDSLAIKQQPKQKQTQKIASKKLSAEKNNAPKLKMTSKLVMKDGKLVLCKQQFNNQKLSPQNQQQNQDQGNELQQRNTQFNKNHKKTATFGNVFQGNNSINGQTPQYTVNTHSNQQRPSIRVPQNSNQNSNVSILFNALNKGSQQQILMPGHNINKNAINSNNRIQISNSNHNLFSGVHQNHNTQKLVSVVPSMNSSTINLIPVSKVQILDSQVNSNNRNSTVVNHSSIYSARTIQSKPFIESQKNINYGQPQHRRSIKKHNPTDNFYSNKNFQLNNNRNSANNHLFVNSSAIAQPINAAQFKQQRISRPTTPINKIDQTYHQPHLNNNYLFHMIPNKNDSYQKPRPYSSQKAEKYVRTLSPFQNNNLNLNTKTHQINRLNDVNYRPQVANVFNNNNIISNRYQQTNAPFPRQQFIRKDKMIDNRPNSHASLKERWYSTPVRSLTPQMNVNRQNLKEKLLQKGQFFNKNNNQNIPNLRAPIQLKVKQSFHVSNKLPNQNQNNKRFFIPTNGYEINKIKQNFNGQSIFNGNHQSRTEDERKRILISNQRMPQSIKKGLNLQASSFHLINQPNSIKLNGLNRQNQIKQNRQNNALFSSRKVQSVVHSFPLNPPITSNNLTKLATQNRLSHEPATIQNRLGDSKRMNNQIYYDSQIIQPKDNAFQNQGSVFYHKQQAQISQIHQPLKRSITNSLVQNQGHTNQFLQNQNQAPNTPNINERIPVHMRPPKYVPPKQSISTFQKHNSPILIQQSSHTEASHHPQSQFQTNKQASQQFQRQQNNRQRYGIIVQSQRPPIKTYTMGHLLQQSQRKIERGYQSSRNLEYERRSNEAINTSVVRARPDLLYQSTPSFGNLNEANQYSQTVFVSPFSKDQSNLNHSRHTSRSKNSQTSRSKSIKKGINLESKRQKSSSSQVNHTFFQSQYLHR